MYILWRYTMCHVTIIISVNTRCNIIYKVKGVVHVNSPFTYRWHYKLSGTKGGGGFYRCKSKCAIERISPSFLKQCDINFDRFSLISPFFTAVGKLRANINIMSFRQNSAKVHHHGWKLNECLYLYHWRKCAKDHGLFHQGMLDPMEKVTLNLLCLLRTQKNFWKKQE